ncbi:MAG: class I SAM-dependent methyltransferase [Bacteroidota bacterium]|nr:class I SAM-dependent methyltransferase [Bacteroidota bacterium]
MENDQIKDFYDRFVPAQRNAGVNERHHLILSLVIEHGALLARNVLEIGCGIGTFTGLLAQKARKSRILAVDISPASISDAQSSLKKYRNLELRVLDILSDPLSGLFDMIILPDVLEHIPEEHRHVLFVKLATLLHRNGKILIHSPDPDHLEYLKEQHPEKLQLIDVPLHLGTIVPEIEAAGLRLHYFQRHSIWNSSPDYMALVLVHAPSKLDHIVQARPHSSSDRINTDLPS